MPTSLKAKKGSVCGGWGGECLAPPVESPSSLQSSVRGCLSTGGIKKQANYPLPAFAMEIMNAYMKSNNFGYGFQAAVVVNGLSC